MLWQARWKGESHAGLSGLREYQDLSEVALARETVEGERRRWLGRLQAGDMERAITYLSVTRGVMETFPLWQTMLHLSNHTAHHRAEACVALTALGSPPESVDLIDFMRQGTAGQQS